MQKIKAATSVLKSKVTLTQIFSVALVSVIMSNGDMFGVFSPFCAALCAALSGTLGMLSFVCSLIGYIAFSRLGQGLTYITAMLFIITLGVFFESFELKQTRRSKVIFISLALLICNIISGNFLSYGAIGFLYIIFDVLLCGFCTYFFCDCIEIVKKETLLSKLSSAEQFTLSVTFIILICAFSSFEIGFFNLGRIAGIAAVLCFTQKRNAALGTLGAALVLIGICVYDISLAFTTMLIVFCAIASAYASVYGKAVQILAFALAAIAGVLLVGVDIECVNFLCDVLIGVIVYSFLPKRTLYVDRTHLIESVPNSGEFAASKLFLAAGAIDDIKDEIKNISKKLEQSTAKDISWIGEQTTEKVCKSCKNNMNCWQERFDDTAKAVSVAASNCKQKQIITVSDLPQYFKQNCARASEFANEMNGFYDGFINSRRTDIKLKQMRSLLCEQLDTTKALLEQAGREFSEEGFIDGEASSNAEEFLSRAGMRNARTKVTVKRGLTQVESYCPVYNEFMSAEEIRYGLSEILNVNLDTPQIFKVKNMTKLVANEIPKYYADISVSGIPKNEKDVSGDKVESFFDGRGNVYICLSDGMGSGTRAAIDSDMTCTTLCELLRSGIEINTAIRIVNSSMIVKSGDESFATVDICKINLQNGKAELIKAGAVASYLKSRDKVVRLDSSTLPIGMLNKIVIKRREIQLAKNDLLLMVSDGAMFESTDWIRAALEKINAQDSRLAADSICSLAAKSAPEEDADDITVVAVKLCENNKKQ